MSSASCKAQNCSPMHLAVCLLAWAVAQGCNQSQTADQAMERQFRENPQFQMPLPVAKFAGRVTVDGKSPKKNCTLFVILNDARRLDGASHADHPMIFAACDDKGKFAFSTYGQRDGVVAGKYVVTFVELHRPRPRISKTYISVGVDSGGPDRYRQPDELNNLYNDPDKNVKEAAFNVDLEPTGNLGVEFDLTVTGRQPVAEPGPNAFTGLAVKRPRS
jgi:hypothetical protein